MNLKQKKKEVERLYELCGEFDLKLTAEVPESNERADELIAELNEKLTPHLEPKGEEQVALAVEKAVAKEREASQKRVDELDAKLSQFMLSQSTQTQAQVQGNGGITPDMLKAILQAANEGKTNKAGLTISDWVEPEDRLETPVTLFVPFEKHMITFKKIGGINEAIPNNKPWFKFTNHFRWVQETSTGKVIRKIASITIYSKKELAWLKAHEDFGRIMFEDGGKAIEMTKLGERAQMYVRNLATVNAIPTGQLVQVANSEGIPVSMSSTPDQYRAALAEKRTAEQVARLENAEQTYMQERVMDNQLLKNAGMPVAG
jgi:hypothetical protein